MFDIARMKTSWRWAFVVVAGSALLMGCPKKKDEAADAASDAPAPVAVVEAAAPPPALPKAANEADVAHFGDETKLGGESAKLLSSVIARKSPSTGERIAEVKAGTEVLKVAQRDKSFCVLFPNPKNAQEMLMGWIPESGFSEPGLPPGTCKTDADCKKPTTCLTVPMERTTRCAQVCTEDVQCGAGKICDGEGYGANKALVEFCIPKRADAGATAAADAGATAAADAGAAPSPARDAAAAPHPPADGGGRLFTKPSRF
jgi:hypothetical protein